MTSWAEGSGKAFQDFDSAQSGTGVNLAGQHDVTADERAKFNTDLDAYKAHSGRQLSSATGGRMDAATEAMVSAYKIGQASDDSMWTEKQAYLKAAQQQPLGDLNDPSARLKAMSFITQDKPLAEGEVAAETSDKSACAGASVVGAAFLAEGPEGLRKVMKAIEAQDPGGGSTGKYASPEYKALKAKLEKDPNSLSVADIQALQQTTTEVLTKNQANDRTLEIEEGETGIHGKTMDNFMSSEASKDLRKMFEKNGMQIEGIDNDGALDDNAKTGMDHWVVRIKGPDGKQAIYDPLARRGGQVIDFDEGVKHYDNARQDIVGD